MVCEFFLLSSIWFVVVIFWMETISMWLFLCHLFQDRAMYQWGTGFTSPIPTRSCT